MIDSDVDFCLSSPPYWQLPCPGKLSQTPRIFWNLKKKTQSLNLYLNNNDKSARLTFNSSFDLFPFNDSFSQILTWQINLKLTFSSTLLVGSPPWKRAKASRAYRGFSSMRWSVNKVFRYFVLDLGPRRNCPYSLLIVVSWDFIKGISDPTIPGLNKCVLFQ